MRHSTLRASILLALASVASIGATADDLVPLGFYEFHHNGELVEVAPNLVPAAARSYLLRAGVAGIAQISAWHGALFSGAVTPTSALTAANFNGTLTEFVNYTEGTRPAWVQDAELAQAIENTTTLMQFTIGAGGGTINGIAILSVNQKGASTGTLLSATRLGAPRSVLEGDVLQFKYKLQLNAA